MQRGGTLVMQKQVPSPITIRLRKTPFWKRTVSAAALMTSIALGGVATGVGCWGWHRQSVQTEQLRTQLESATLDVRDGKVMFDVVQKQILDLQVLIDKARKIHKQDGGDFTIALRKAANSMGIWKPNDVDSLIYNLMYMRHIKPYDGS